MPNVKGRMITNECVYVQRRVVYYKLDCPYVADFIFNMHMTKGHVIGINTLSFLLHHENCSEIKVVDPTRFEPESILGPRSFASKSVALATGRPHPKLEYNNK